MIAAYKILKTPLFIVVPCLAVMLLTAPAFAFKKRDKAIYAYTTTPYWNVGIYSRILSKACQKRNFAQKRQFRYIIAFIGDTGKTITGIASKTWNLYDPLGLAEDEQTYHFYNDGFSNCEVYVAVEPRN